MTPIQCEECGSELHGRDIDFSSGQGRCRQCGAAVQKSVGSRRGAAGAKRTVALPEHVEVTQVPDGAGGTGLRIRVPWRDQGSSAAGELAAILIVGGSAVLGDQLELPLLVTVAVVALSIAVLLVVRAINFTVITVDGGHVAVRHKPVPWLSHSIQAASIEQLYVDRRPVAQKRFDYNVRVKLEDGSDIKFLRSLNEPLVALYLEQCIESHLQIVDRAVAGEYQHRYSQHDPQAAQQAAQAQAHPGQAAQAQAHPGQAQPGQTQQPPTPPGYPPAGYPPQGPSQPPPAF